MKKKKRPNKRSRKRAKKQRETTPVTMLAGELAILRRDLRKTIRAYGSRLEVALEESMATVSSKRAEALSREQLHDIRDLTIMVRKRKLKPEKGRRKDLRKIDSLIHDLHSITHPGGSQNSLK
jgi:hypothetical protein